MVQKATRQSNFELLRIVAMFMIVLYHLLLFLPPSYQHPIYTALLSPLHVGVILFVLISGYFHINFSFRGIVRLLLPIYVIHVPFEMYRIFNAGEYQSLCSYKSFFIISNTPYWFVRTYLYLLLIAPLINRCLSTSNRLFRIYLLLILSFISIYIGMWHTDPSLSDGKNLVNFMYIYIIGDSLRCGCFMNKIVTWKIVLLYIGYNIVIITLYMMFQRGAIMRIFYPYNSIGLYINAIMLFVIFSRIRICNKCGKWVNHVAGSMFTVYIIHQDPTILSWIISFMTDFYEEHLIPYSFLLFAITISLSIMISSVIIDNLLRPIWRVVIPLAYRLDSKIKI